jgi:hypothetical protein
MWSGGARMKPEVYAGVVLIGDEMMVFTGLHHTDVASGKRVWFAVDLHHGLSLQDHEYFVVGFMHVTVAAAGAVVSMCAETRWFEPDSPLAKVGAGYDAGQEMAFTNVFKLCQAILFHCAER